MGYCIGGSVRCERAKVAIRQVTQNTPAALALVAWRSVGRVLKRCSTIYAPSRLTSRASRCGNLRRSSLAIARVVGATIAYRCRQDLVDIVSRRWPRTKDRQGCLALALELAMQFAWSPGAHSRGSLKPRRCSS